MFEQTTEACLYYMYKSINEPSAQDTALVLRDRDKSMLHQLIFALRGGVNGLCGENAVIYRTNLDTTEYALIPRHTHKPKIHH